MLSMIKEDLDPGKVLLIHDSLSGEACAALIRRSEGLLYEPGTVAGEVTVRPSHQARPDQF